MASIFTIPGWLQVISLKTDIEPFISAPLLILAFLLPQEQALFVITK